MRYLSGQRLASYDRVVGEADSPIPEGLRPALAELEAYLDGEPPEKLAELVLAQLGTATLTLLRPTLESEGLKPPERWNGSAALGFVSSLGFPADFAMSVSPQSATVQSGQTANFAVTITPANGFTGSVALSCSGLPVHSTCTFSPNPVDATKGAASLQISTGVALADELFCGGERRDRLCDKKF